MKIGNIDLGERPVLLAPMEDVTDASFRYIGKDDVKKLTALVRDATGLEPETLYCVPPVENDPDDPLIEDLFRAMSRNWSGSAFQFRKDKILGATDAFQFSDLGLPIVIYAPDAHGAHQPDEHGSLRSAEEYMNFFINWLQKSR